MESCRRLIRCSTVSQEVWNAPETCQILFRGSRWEIPTFHSDIRGIETNPDKFQAVITMRNPINVKEVQHLTRCLSTLSHFLSCVDHKAFLYFPPRRRKRYLNGPPRDKRPSPMWRPSSHRPSTSLARGRSRYYSSISHSWLDNELKPCTGDRQNRKAYVFRKKGVQWCRSPF